MLSGRAKWGHIKTRLFSALVTVTSRRLRVGKVLLWGLESTAVGCPRFHPRSVDAAADLVFQPRAFLASPSRS